MRERRDLVAEGLAGAGRQDREQALPARPAMTMSRWSDPPSGLAGVGRNEGLSKSCASSVFGWWCSRQYLQPGSSQGISRSSWISAARIRERPVYPGRQDRVATRDPQPRDTIREAGYDAGSLRSAFPSRRRRVSHTLPNRERQRCARRLLNRGAGSVSHRLEQRRETRSIRPPKENGTARHRRDGTPRAP